MSSVTLLPIQGTLANGSAVLCPVLIHDDRHAVLVDAGLPGTTEAIVTAMEDAGVPLGRLTHIVVTHADMDHIGGLAALRAVCPHPVEVLCHEKEQPFVQSDVPPLRLKQMEEGLATLSGPILEHMTALVHNLRVNYKKLGTPVDRTVKDGEALPCGAVAVESPGHTPGHLCLWVPEHRVLIAGDALTVHGGKLLPGPDALNWDRALTRASLKRLAALDAQAAACYHGGWYEGSVSAAIATAIN